MPIDMQHIAYIKDSGQHGSYAVARSNIDDLAAALEALAADALTQANVLRNPGGAA